MCSCDPVIVGHIVRAPEEVSANPEATRFQSGRYPDMEQELYALLVARATQLSVDVKRLDGGNVLSDAELWTKANEILKRSRGSDESVSVAWVHRFKRRHGLHRSQLKRATDATVAESVEVLGSVEDGHLKAGNSMALRKAGTEEELDRKCALVAEVAAQIEVHESAQKGDDTTSTEAVEVMPPANSDGMPDLTRERERIAQRRLELMERKMERELAAQKRHSEEQVSRLEKLHREQQKIQQEQHAQLLITIQQQQAMMSDLIKSLTPTTSSGNLPELEKQRPELDISTD
ncbi:Uncharacterized protein PHPALM_36707 [Phytophthora palmivora]|uniref:HTH CENPB-type domain-containing protein n=1 Tax=Phytophthora palmivora TaxID=4796 RepID=A0A2P4WZA1_9STRA|nr:Uncharacterized protein PHPALM_36707 [Phytophthora palmivora]